MALLTLCINASCNAALAAEDFELLQLFGETFQAADNLAKVVKAARVAKKGEEVAEVLQSVRGASDVVMVAASALAAQVYPDSRCGAVNSLDCQVKLSFCGKL